MWRRSVLWMASTIVVVGASLDFRFFNPRIPRQLTFPPSVSCVEIPKLTDRLGRASEEGWRHHKKVPRSIHGTAPTFIQFGGQPLTAHTLLPRFDRGLITSKDIVNEHAKLVQDINSLRQIMLIQPIAEENKDYDDSIFHEIIETSSTSTARPTTKSTTKPTTKLTTSRPAPKPTKSTLPLILLGGASTRYQVKTQPFKLPKPTISLVGTSISPLLKHPYPFVYQASPRKPIKVCVTSMPMYPTNTTRRPSLWERFLNLIRPR